MSVGGGMGGGHEDRPDAETKRPPFRAAVMSMVAGALKRDMRDLAVIRLDV